MSQEFKLKKKTRYKRTRYYFIKDIDQNDLMTKKRIKVCTTLNHIEHFFILASVSSRMCFNFNFCFFSR